MIAEYLQKIWFDLILTLSELLELRKGAVPLKYFTLILSFFI